MEHKSTLVYILTLSILSTGCSSKKCVGPTAHKGLYNAITCNYDNNIQELAVKLDGKALERNQLFHNYQRLIAQTTNKKDKINQLDKEIQLIENEMESVLKIVSNIKNKQTSINAIAVLKLKAKLKSLNMNILNKSTFFDIDDALYTNKKLLVASDKPKYVEGYDKNVLKNKVYAGAYDKNVLKNRVYAEAYNKNLLKEAKYAEAFEKKPKEAFAKAYQKDIEKDKKIRIALSSKIKNIQSSLSSTNLSSNQDSITKLMEEIKKYKNSLKKS